MNTTPGTIVVEESESKQLHALNDTIRMMNESLDAELAMSDPEFDRCKPRPQLRINDPEVRAMMRHNIAVCAGRIAGLLTPISISPKESRPRTNTNRPVQGM